MKLKKQISFLLSVMLILSVITVAVTASDSNPIDVLLTEAGIEKTVYGDINGDIAYAEDGNGSSLVVGRGNQGFTVLFSEKGGEYKKLDIDINAAVAEAIENARPSEWLDPETGDVVLPNYLYTEILSSYAYYYEGAFQVLATVITSDFFYPVMITVNGSDSFDAVMLPALRCHYLGNITVFLEKCGDTYVLVPEYSAFTGSDTFYGTFYTSTDLVKWTEHTTPEKAEDNGNLLKVEDISADGTILFSDIQGDTSNPESVSYFYTENYTDYHTLTGGMLDTEGWASVSMEFKSSPDGDAFYAVRTEIEEWENGYRSAGVELWYTSAPDGEWTKAAEHNGNRDQQLLTVNDSGACLMVYKNDTTHVYKYEHGVCKTITTDIDLSKQSSADGEKPLQYGDMILLWENGDTLVCTTDMWETVYRMYFPEWTSRFRMNGDAVYFYCTGTGGSNYTVSAQLLASMLPGSGAESDGAGDIDKSGKVNLKDVSAVLKHIARWEISVDTDIADVNKDGRVNLSDVSLMLKFIAGWNVILR